MNVDLTDLISVVALVSSLGVASRQIYLERRITLVAHIDTIHVQGSASTRTRLVLSNSGPAVARQVEISLYDSNGQRISDTSGDPSVIPELPAGVDFHIALANLSTTPTKVVIIWVTGRARRECRELPLSQRVIV